MRIVINKENITKNIFFSYAWKDRPIAMRIYWDLVRSNHGVWRDQIDGYPAENFKKEFLSKIDDCDFFILLDSENYRNNSYWCKTELIHFLESKQNVPRKKIIVCLIQNKGAWRESDDFFVEHLNLLKYIDFSFREIYDNDNHYECAISELSNILGSRFVPWYKFPYEKDFEDELSQSTLKINDVDREILFNDYYAIRTRKNQGISVELRLETLSTDVLRLGINSIFPLLLYGLNKADLNKISEAKAIFENIVQLFPKDPRGYRGLAAIFFNLKDFKGSIDTYKKCIDVTETYGNDIHMEYLPEIFINLSSALIEINKFQDALEYALKNYYILSSKNKINLQTILNLSYCYEALGNNNELRKVLEKGLLLFWGEPEIHGRYARYNYVHKNINNAIVHYEIAFKYDQSIIYCVSLALLYYSVKNKIEFVKYSDISLKLDILALSDYYYYGLIYYLKGNIEMANYFYYLSKTSELYYNEIVELY